MTAGPGTAITLACALCLGGCIMLPIPARDVSPHGLERASKEHTGPAAELECGRTTRREVLLALGPPEHAWGNERFFAYLSDAVDMHVLVVAAGYTTVAGGVIDMGKRYALFLEFDPAGVLRRTSMTKLSLAAPSEETAGAMQDFEHGKD